MGPVSRRKFLQTILELIYVLTHRIAQPGLVLSDLIVPDEFRRAYTIGGRFQDPQFSELPWFARFLVLAALNEVLLAFSALSARTFRPEKIFCPVQVIARSHTPPSDNRRGGTTRNTRSGAAGTACWRCRAGKICAFWSESQIGASVRLPKLRPWRAWKRCDFPPVKTRGASHGRHSSQLS